MELWRNVIPIALQMLVVYMLMLAKIVINEVLPWRLRQHILLKHLQLSTQLCNITSQNTIILTLHYTKWYCTCCCARHTSHTYIRVFNLVMKNLRYSTIVKSDAWMVNPILRGLLLVASCWSRDIYLLQKLLLEKESLTTSSARFKTCPLLNRMQLTCIAWMQSLNT
jgi:hypothetical protein